MKKNKIVFTTIFVLFLVLTNTLIPVNAKTNYDMALQKRGFPSDYLELISFEDKVELYNNEDAFFLVKQ